ncbi:MAG: hypothetical protein H7Z41_09530 [Cytophagales bacterium]|nr:hypothetical protein [Armatimonadota bacterium]
MIQRPRVRRAPSPFGQISLGLRRHSVIVPSTAIPAREQFEVEASETERLLSRSHDLVAQMREAVGRLRLDI